MRGAAATFAAMNAAVDTTLALIHHVVRLDEVAMKVSVVEGVGVWCCAGNFVCSCSAEYPLQDSPTSGRSFLFS